MAEEASSFIQVHQTRPKVSPVNNQNNQMFNIDKYNHENEPLRHKHRISETEPNDMSSTSVPFDDI